jgi:hypothetical protein
MLGELRDAGLLTVGTDAGGRETLTLTPEGAQVATQMSMSSEEYALAAAGGAGGRRSDVRRGPSLAVRASRSGSSGAPT